MHDRLNDLFGIPIGIVADELLGFVRLGNLGRDFDLLQGGGSGIDSRPVHLHDVLALLAEGLLDGVLDELDGLFLWEDAGDFKNAACMTVLILVPKPDLSEIFRASML